MEKTEKATKNKPLNGLRGWLALFTAGQFLAIAITVYRFFAEGPLTESDVDNLNNYQSGLGDSLRTLITFEDIMILIYVCLLVTTIVLLFKKHKLAKWFAIAGLVFIVVYGSIDYAIATSLFNSSGLSQNTEIQSVLTKYGGDVGRSVIIACIWIPYFLISKRVKATLTR